MLPTYERHKRTHTNPTNEQGHWRIVDKLWFMAADQRVLEGYLISVLSPASDQGIASIIRAIIERMGSMIKGDESDLHWRIQFERLINGIDFDSL